MAIWRNTSLPRRCTLALTAAPLLLMLPLLVLLAGCPSADQSTGLGNNPNATAPSLKPNGAQPNAAQQAANAAAAQQTALTQQTLAAQQHAQTVQTLLNRVQSSYSSGVSNYNANHLDAARQDFDAAVDAMLSSGMDLKNDPQLADEFDQLLSAINSLELVALKQGNGFSPTLEEAPADAADEVTFAPNPELVGKLNAELKTTTSDLPLVVNDYVAGWISAFSTKPALHAHLVASLRRAGKYKEMISKILRDQGVPQDLIYQAITESGFQPQVVNRKSGAGGMWQFMPFGNYGLERNGYFDERFDPEKSTIAYAKYMKFLYAQTGDWYLAMAAYDWGLGRVQKLVAKTGYADYWELYRRGGLPAETKAYIPSVIAAIIMARHPDQYGLTDLRPDEAVLSDKITTNYAIDLRLVADVTNATVPEIVALNPALLRLSTPRDISYDLHIPPGTRQLFTDRVKEISEENRASWRFHVVKPGETLDEIANSLHGRATEIATLNDVTAAQPIEAGDELVVPVAAVSVSAGVQRYTPHAHDTLITIADRFGITAEQLRAWNHLSSNRVVPGRSLYVAEPVHLAPGSRATRGRHAYEPHAKRSASPSHGAASRATSRASSHGTAHAVAAPSRAASAKRRSNAARPAKKRTSR
jgi:membrane-bound lytic murein transglycosylase D